MMTSASAETFALIDLASAQCKRNPLSTSQRARNIAHLFNENDDSVILDEYGKDLFLQDYFDATEPSGGCD